MSCDTEDRSSSRSGAAEPQAEEGFGLLNGTLTSGYTGSVFAGTSLDSSTGIPSTQFTATNVVYKRCMLTAAHVDDLSKKPTLLFQTAQYPWGTAPNFVLTALQEAARRRQKRAIAQGESPDVMAWEDLEVVWVTNYTGYRSYFRNPSTPTLTLKDYKPLELLPDLGLKSGEAPTNYGQKNGYAPPVDKSVNATIVGYGKWSLDQTSAPWPNQRKGEVAVTGFFQGSQQSTPRAGAWYIDFPLQNDFAKGNAVLGGDSGGPLLVDGKVAGVASSGGSIGNLLSVFGVHTALDTGTVPGSDVQSNYQWVKDRIEEICTKYVTFAKPSGGKIVGSVSPAQTILSPYDFDDKVVCGRDTVSDDTNCIEGIHENQTVSVTATPAEGMKFIRWEAYSATQGSNCVCAKTPTQPDCTINFDKVGFYSNMISNDVAGCVAVFGPK
jgi:hypothetical protein